MIKACGYILLCGLAVLLNSGCRKGGCNVIAYRPFNTTVSLVEFNELTLPMQPIVVGVERGGIAGLIVMQISNGQYVAYDRCSTVNPENRCAVEIEDGGIVAVDPCSGAKYILTNGSPAEIAECPLRPYHVRLQGSILLISN